MPLSELYYSKRKRSCRVMSPDLPRCDGISRISREAVEVMHPSCLLPTIQGCRSIVTIWGYFSWSGQGLGPSEMFKAHVFQTKTFFFPDGIF